MANVGTCLLVAGDNLPAIKLLLTDEATGAPINMSAAGTTVTVKMRAAGTTTVLATAPGVFVTNGSDGLFTFAFAGNTLSVAPGYYEFEININWNGQIQRVFDILRAQVRAAF